MQHPWWRSEEQVYRPITEWTLQRNEWKEHDGGDKMPYVPQKYNATIEKARNSNSDETDEEFDWFKA